MAFVYGLFRFKKDTWRFWDVLHVFSDGPSTFRLWGFYRSYAVAKRLVPYTIFNWALYIHTYIHTFIHSFIHTYIHMNNR